MTSGSTQVIHPAELHAMLQARADAIAARSAERRDARTQPSRGDRRTLPLRVALFAGVMSTVLFAVVVAALVSDTASCDIEVADKTGYDICTTAAGATAEYIGEDNISFGSSGTGTFNSFVRIQGSPTESGYNTDATGQGLEFDTKGGTWTHSILVSDIPVLNISGTNYWELFADINDGNNTELISLNDLEVWFTDDPALTDYPFGADAVLVYDFEGDITINDVNPGSGRGDLRYRIPLTNITIPAGCDYGNATCETYFVLYNQWGTTDAAHNSDGGFEEWKVKQYPTLKIIKNTVGGDGTFTFTLTGSPTAPPVTNPSITTVGLTGATPIFIVDPGTYTINEDGPPAGWSLTGATCSINGGAPTAYTEGSDLVLGETTHVVCTFTNTKDGRIEIEKQTLPNADPASFTFTGDVAGSLSDGQSAGQNVAPGNYSSTETIPAGWDLTSIICDDSNSTGNTTTGVASFVVAPGETVRCVFTNTKISLEGCTPGFWQGGVGEDLWDEENDLDWGAHGGDGFNPFVTSDTFISSFPSSGDATVDGMTMIEIVGSGGTNVWPRKAARDLVAAYLNASFGIDYPYGIPTILADWNTAVANGTAGFKIFHAKYDAANNLGCPL